MIEYWREIDTQGDDWLVVVEDGEQTHYYLNFGEDKGERHEIDDEDGVRDWNEYTSTTPEHKFIEITKEEFFLELL